MGTQLENGICRSNLGPQPCQSKIAMNYIWKHGDSHITCSTLWFFQLLRLQVPSLNHPHSMWFECGWYFGNHLLSLTALTLVGLLWSSKDFHSKTSHLKPLRRMRHVNRCNYLCGSFHLLSPEWQSHNGSLTVMPHNPDWFTKQTKKKINAPTKKTIIWQLVWKFRVTTT